MSKLQVTMDQIRLLDQLAQRHSVIHRLHPLTKLLAALFYILAVMSFSRHEVLALIPFVLFPMTQIVLADLPTGLLIRRLMMVEPLVIGIGILNPLVERQMILIGNLPLAAGWLTFGSILIKSSLTILISLLLIATTGLNELAAALRQLKVPRIFVLQLLLTYRYLTVLLDEASVMLRSYHLRAPARQGVRIQDWGALVGSLFLRTFARAERIYAAMLLRGFSGEYRTGDASRMSWRDALWLTIWGGLFLASRLINIPVLLGTTLSGVIQS